jgi:hypothetical protein
MTSPLFPRRERLSNLFDGIGILFQGLSITSRRFIGVFPQKTFSF